MTNITIQLSDEYRNRLEELAQKAGVAPEQLLQSSIEHWLAKPDEEFVRAAEHVFKKNAELYRRLA